MPVAIAISLFVATAPAAIVYMGKLSRRKVGMEARNRQFP
jgi:hypothetical protein